MSNDNALTITESDIITSQIFILGSAVVKKQILVYLTWRLLSLYNALPQRNNQIKLTHYGEENERVLDPQAGRANDKLKFSYGGPNQNQAGTIPPMEFLGQGCIRA